LESVDEEKLMTLADYLKPEVFKRGIEKSRRDIAKTLLSKGMNIEEVVETTKLSKEEVKKLLN